MGQGDVQPRQLRDGGVGIVLVFAARTGIWGDGGSGMGDLGCTETEGQ